MRNLNELVLLLGHTTPAMARRHYLGAATYADAQAYFEGKGEKPTGKPSNATCRGSLLIGFAEKRMVSHHWGFFDCCHFLISSSTSWSHFRMVLR